MQRAHIDGVIFMALCASASNNKRVGGHCRNIGRALWHLPRRLRNVSFVRVYVYVSVHLPYREFPSPVAAYKSHGKCRRNE